MFLLDFRKDLICKLQVIWTCHEQFCL